MFSPKVSQAKSADKKAPKPLVVKEQKEIFVTDIENVIYSI
jgi:hypothetical protein